MAQGAKGTGFTAIRVGQLSDGFTQGTPITYMEKGTVAVDPASISASSVGETSITIANAALGDTVQLNPPAAGLTAGLVICDCRVSAAGTVKVRIFNSTAGAVDEASGTWDYMLIRK